jgi:hypothetical protein
LESRSKPSAFHAGDAALDHGRDAPRRRAFDRRRDEGERDLAADLANTMICVSCGLVLAALALDASRPDVREARRQIEAAREGAGLSIRLARRLVHGRAGADPTARPTPLTRALDTAIRVARAEMSFVSDVERIVTAEPMVLAREDDLVRVLVSLLLGVTRGLDGVGRIVVRIGATASRALVGIVCSSAHTNRPRPALAHELATGAAAGLTAKLEGTLTSELLGDARIAIHLVLPLRATGA